MSAVAQPEYAGLSEIFASHAKMANTLMERAGQLIVEATAFQSNPLYRGSTTLQVRSDAQRGDNAARFTHQVNYAYEHGYETRKMYEKLGNRVEADDLTRVNMQAEVKVKIGEAQLKTARDFAGTNNAEIQAK